MASRLFTVSEPEEEEWDEDNDVIHDVEDSEPQNHEVSIDGYTDRSSILTKWLILFLLHIQVIYRV